MFPKSIKHWYASKIYQTLICLQNLSNTDMSPKSIKHWYVSKSINADRTPNSINVDMFWMFINSDIFWMSISVDRTLISINWICLGCLFLRIELQNLSTEYVLDMSTRIELQFYQRRYDSKIYQLEYVLEIINVDIIWIFISANRTPKSINWICLGYVNTNRTPILSTVIELKSINLIRLGCLFPRIELQIISSEYVLDIFNTDIFVCLFVLIKFSFLSTWYVLDVLFQLIELQNLSTEYV